MMGRGTAPKHVESLDKNKFGKLVRPVGFIKKKFVTMHGHMSRCKVTCHDARSHVTMHGHTNVQFLVESFSVFLLRRYDETFVECCAANQEMKFGVECLL